MGETEGDETKSDETGRVWDRVGWGGGGGVETGGGGRLQRKVRQRRRDRGGETEAVRQRRMRQRR